ncbi:MAG: radical SAM family heme chaperone HemW [Chitinophagaceae bacterium]|nr:radical SAM family heme chaperone HemW [Chitinophagaceae bacterium]
MPGIYIHIPFCKQACHYCNFHFSTSLAQKDKMVEAIVKEIHMAQSPLPISIGIPMEENIVKIDAKKSVEIISTVYFGGGTPSILDVADLQLIFGALQQRFVFADDIEITLEANPDDITEKKLADWKSLGVNRLSVGIQSFMDKELIWMNRVHTAGESFHCIDLIQQAGFSNFSVDLIYGSPVLSDTDWQKNVNLVIEKNIPHISCYALTVEPKTALDKMIALHKKEPMDAEKQARQFFLLMDWMDAAGYEHYEISNFAKPGFRSKHNSSYWSQTPDGQGESYFAFGPAAHAFDGKKRKWNIANNALYIKSLLENKLPVEEEILTETQRLNEYIMTSLRTIEGLDLDFVNRIFGVATGSKIKMVSSKYINSGKVRSENNKLILSREGKLFADGIAADLFF